MYLIFSVGLVALQYHHVHPPYHGHFADTDWIHTLSLYLFPLLPLMEGCGR